MLASSHFGYQNNVFIEHTVLLTYCVGPFFSSHFHLPFIFSCTFIVHRQLALFPRGWCPEKWLSDVWSLRQDPHPQRLIAAFTPRWDGGHGCSALCVDNGKQQLWKGCVCVSRALRDWFWCLCVRSCEMTDRTLSPKSHFHSSVPQHNIWAGEISHIPLLNVW